MNFLIFRDFFRFFLEFSEFIFDLNLLKTIKNDKKGVYFRAGPTWVRRGMQGHVAEPRGPTRAPAWSGGDTWHYLYLIVLIYGYSTYSLPIIERELLTLTSVTCYKRDRFLNLLHVRLIPLFQVRPNVGLKRLMHRASIRWTRGPSDHRTMHVR